MYLTRHAGIPDERENYLGILGLSDKGGSCINIYNVLHVKMISGIPLLNRRKGQ